MFILDIIFLPLGLFMVLSPKLFYKFIKRFKSIGSPETPTDLYYKHIRQIGILFFLLGVISTIATFKFDM